MPIKEIMSKWRQFKYLCAVIDFWGRGTGTRNFVGSYRFFSQRSNGRVLMNCMKNELYQMLGTYFAYCFSSQQLGSERNEAVLIVERGIIRLQERLADIVLRYIPAHANFLSDSCKRFGSIQEEIRIGICGKVSLFPEPH